MVDILERLQSPQTSLGTLWPQPNLHEEAADEITRLREENARLREALEPFAKMADELDDEWENEGMHWIDCHQFEHVPTVGDLRAARAAIQDGKTKHVP